MGSFFEKILRTVVFSWYDKRQTDQLGDVISAEVLVHDLKYKNTVHRSYVTVTDITFFDLSHAEKLL
jgi:hypothetical protein